MYSWWSRLIPWEARWIFSVQARLSRCTRIPPGVFNLRHRAWAHPNRRPCNMVRNTWKKITQTLWVETNSTKPISHWLQIWAWCINGDTTRAWMILPISSEIILVHNEHWIRQDWHINRSIYVIITHGVITLGTLKRSISGCVLFSNPL